MPVLAQAAPWSVATHSRPRASIVQLSGEANQPAALVAGFHMAPTSATRGSPHLISMSHLKVAAAWSPSGAVSSMMWPNSFCGRGLALSASSGRRRSLLVRMTITLPVPGTGCTSSGRSMRVAFSASPASRASISTSACEANPLAGGERALAEHQRQPLHAAVVVEAGHRQRALRQQAHVVRLVARPVGVLGDEAIDVVELRIIAGVDDDAAVLVDDRLRAFMPEAAERRVLDRRGGGIHGIDLDHPVEAIALVGFLVDVEALVELAPAVPVAGDAVALVALLLRAAEALGEALAVGGLLVGPEVAVAVLLARQVGAPRRLAAGAIVERAERAAPGRVGLGLQAVVPGGGAVEASSASPP